MNTNELPITTLSRVLAQTDFDFKIGELFDNFEWEWVWVDAGNGDKFLIMQKYVNDREYL